MTLISSPLRVLLIPLMAIWLASCSTTVNTRHVTYLDHDFPFTLPDPVWTQKDKTVLQQVTLTRGGQRHNFNAILELKRERVKIALLDVTGGRAFDIDWTSSNLKVSKSDKIPDEIDGSLILAQIVLAFWPVEQVKKGLPVNVELEQTHSGRMLKNKNGTIMTIRSLGGNPWTSQSEILNRIHNVQFLISSNVSGGGK
ncbi:DUF3261 domain-containing protein [Sneathiella sp. P13V-1]|uniref:DUF3261 domain-containing protein n=1 Tax=Sneathiella sp. P13V-1 TaxID=2697366 RepID=UPI00187B9642|nr:DUF3261 domain-containing protein [Sneathiella sp. P13V-1]MBE7636512.1 DUF3261 domain-containing protein [Sneathiella sp. P13V-1]